MKPRLRGQLGFGLAAVMTVLAGCGTLGSKGIGSGAGDLLDFYRYAENLDDEARDREIRKFRNWVRDDRCDPDRIRLVMLLMQGDDGAERRALSAIAPCREENDGAPGNLGNIVHLLDQQLNLRQRNRILLARGKKLEQRLNQAEAERKELKQQLEALKDIERSIRQRD